MRSIPLFASLTLFAFIALRSLQPPFAAGVPPDTLTTFVPDRPELLPKPQKIPPPIPIIAGPSSWGEIKQDGRKITIAGNDRWWVEQGEIRKDGKLQVLWFHADGRAAPGLYTINPNGSITGHWNWGTDVTTDEDGVMHGLNQPETLRAVRVMPEVE